MRHPSIQSRVVIPKELYLRHHLLQSGHCFTVACLSFCDMFGSTGVKPLPRNILSLYCDAPAVAETVLVNT